MDQGRFRYELIIENYIFKIKNIVFTKLYYTVQYVQCIDILFWSPTKFNLIFYFMIYYNFSNIHQNKHKREKEKNTKKNHLKILYIRFSEFSETKYMVFKFKVVT